MKILSINTHSIIEDNYEEKCDIFVEAINLIGPDIIAMQEVNQTKDAKIVCGYKDIKEDNHALKIYKRLKAYHFSWLKIKSGYEIFEEGLAIFSKKPIINICDLLLSNTNDFNNWKKRMAQIVKIDDLVISNVHMGWWDDLDEPFCEQFEKLNNYLSPISDTVFITGDFNSPADEKNTGYDMVLSCGWYDTYTLADKKDSGHTITKKIAGWEKNGDSKRIDYIFTNKKMNIKSSRVIFDGNNEKIISDHNGVIIEI